VNDEESVQYGREAGAVIGNRAYQDMYNAVHNAIFAAATKSGTPDDVRIRLLLCIEMGQQYRKYLEKALADGKFAAESIKHTEQQRRWFQRSA
jgi:hypothetical protein